MSGERNHVRLDHILAYGARRIIYIARGCAVSRVLTFVRCFSFYIYQNYCIWPWIAFQAG